MRPTEKIEKMIKKFEIDINPEKDREKLDELLQAQSQSKQSKPGTSHYIWRKIMKNPITKIATVAAALVIIASAVILLDHFAKPAYAIEQTVKAMRSIKSVHAYCTDWDGSQVEVWAQINTETGHEEYYSADQNKLLIVGTPEKTYYYHKDKNLVRIRNEYVPASEIRFSHFFEDIIEWVEQYDGELSISSKYDEHLKREVIIVHVTAPAQEDFGELDLIVYVDMQSKLPIRVKKLKRQPGMGVKSVDRLEYNVTIPEGLFEFEVPKDAEIVTEE